MNTTSGAAGSLVWQVGVAVVVAMASGCASTYDLEPDLNAAVGVYAGEFSAALRAGKTLISDDGTTRILRYALGEGCRFVLEMDSRTFVVKSWRYADAASSRDCRRIPARRPI